MKTRNIALGLALSLLSTVSSANTNQTINVSQDILDLEKRIKEASVNISEKEERLEQEKIATMYLQQARGFIATEREKLQGIYEIVKRNDDQRSSYIKPPPDRRPGWRFDIGKPPVKALRELQPIYNRITGKDSATKELVYLSHPEMQRFRTEIEGLMSNYEEKAMQCRLDYERNEITQVTRHYKTLKQVNRPYDMWKHEVVAEDLTRLKGKAIERNNYTCKGMETLRTKIEAEVIKLYDSYIKEK